MANAAYVFIVFALLTIAAFMIPGPFRERFAGHSHSIDISFTENKETARLLAYYPRDRATSINAYVKDHFGLTDITEMRVVEVSGYRTPDSSMSFDMKVRDGFLKIVMNKKENTLAAYDRLRAAAEGIQAILAGGSPPGESPGR